MKVICNRGALVEALGVVGTAVVARTPKPVLQCIRLDADNEGGNAYLTLSATDLEIAVRYTNTHVDVQTPGSTLLPADKLQAIVRESVDDTLSIELVDKQAVIKGADSEFKIFTQDPKDFPEVPTFEGDPDFSVAGGPLRQLIHQTLFAAAREGTRYAFNGTLVLIDNGDLTFVTTDGRRLALARTPVSGDAKAKKDKAPDPIVPTKAMSLVDKLVGDPEEMVGIQLRDNRILVHTADATLTSNLVEGTFPPFRDVIPKDNDKAMTAATADFLSAVRRASLLTNEESKGVRMHFKDGGLELSSRNPDSGEAKVNFACNYEGDEVEIGFNPQFLESALKVVDTDEVRFELSAANRPGLLKAGEGFLYVIMPVNLQ
ncbi:MAG: DNA polymerase III subunit beta [Planctomycetota bacterium]